METLTKSRFQLFIRDVITKFNPSEIISNVESGKIAANCFSYVEPEALLNVQLKFVEDNFKSVEEKNLISIASKNRICILDISSLTESQIASTLRYLLSISKGTIIFDETRSYTEYARLLKILRYKNLVIGNSPESNLNGSKTNFSYLLSEQILEGNEISSFSCLCILSVRNEFEIIKDAIDDVLQKGFDAHVVDNWSDDGTWELMVENFADHPSVTLERFPSEPATDFFLKNLLNRCEAIANQATHDWIIRLDADERVESCSPDYTLKEIIYIADRCGYDVIDFTVFEFRPSEKDEEKFSVYPSFGYFTGLSSHQNIQRAWKNVFRRVKFAASGGHEIIGQKTIFPANQLLKHYSFRNPSQSHRKVFVDRLPNYNLRERSTGWHHQYDDLKVSDTFLWKSETLIGANLEFTTENVLEVSFRSGNFPSEEPTMFSLTEAAKPLITGRKSVLICAINLYSSLPNGGGATYKRVIETNPEIDFFSFKTYLDPSNDSPINLIEIPIGLKDAQGSVLENLLRATSGSTFDYLDVPDWLLPSQSIVKSLQEYQVNVGKIICSLHGSNSMVFKTHPFNPKKFLQTIFFKKKERILYREAHYFYGFSDKYASSLKIKKKFIKISPFEMLQDCKSLATNSDLSKEKRLVPIFVGRKEYTKGFDLFLKVISRNELFEKAIIYATSAFGYEEYRKMLDFEVSCIDRIELSHIASQEEILEVVKLSNSLFVFPSRFDSFNLTFFQILMSGGLIVCSENVNARKFADELQLKYLDFSMIKAKIDAESLIMEGTKILQHNRNRIVEIQKELTHSKRSSFGSIYV